MYGVFVFAYQSCLTKKLNDHFRTEPKEQCVAYKKNKVFLRLWMLPKKLIQLLRELLDKKSDHHIFLSHTSGSFYRNYSYF